MMKTNRHKVEVPIEDMAKVFSSLNISFKKLLELYTYTGEETGNLRFNPKDLEAYLTKEEIETYCEIQKQEIEKDDFMLISQGERYEKEVKLRQIVRHFDAQLRKQLGLDGNKEGINMELRNIILHVEMRPLVYLRKRSIYELDAFLKNIIYGGYALGKTYADTLDENSYWGYFSEWLGRKYDSVVGMSWCQILMERTQNEERAFWEFFNEFRDYLEEVEHYRSKNEVILFLTEKLMPAQLFQKEGLHAELEDYPNKYAKEYYERKCYQVKVYKEEQDEHFGHQRRYLQTFYVDSQLEHIWVRYRDSILYQTLEEFLMDNEKWYIQGHSEE